MGSSAPKPTSENFKPVVQAWAYRTGELRPKCLSLSPDSLQGSRRGWPGLATSDVMGLGVHAFALRTPEASGQMQRDKTLRRFELLAKEGFFDAVDGQTALANGELAPARQFTLTKKGWAESSNGCLYPARPEVLEVVSLARVEPDPDGLRAYDVTYKIGNATMPEWASSEAGKELFGNLAQFVSASEKRVRLIRGKQDWLPEPVLRTKEGPIDPAKLVSTLDELLPALDSAAILLLGKDHAFLSNPQACLMLPSKTGHDAAEIEWSASGPVSFTFFSGDPVNNVVPRIQETWLLRMTNLVRAGVFREEEIPRDTQRNRPGGTKFTLKDAYLEHVSLDRPGCLKLGKITVDVLANTIEHQGRQDGTLQFNFKAVGHLDDAAWIRGLPWAGIREVEAYLDYGIPISGSVERKDGVWRLVHAGVAAPVVIELPKVAEAPPGSSSGTVGGASSAGTATSGGSNGLPPAPEGSVHVISVYQALGAGSGNREGSIQVAVGARGAPVTLVLSSYEPVNWQILPDMGARIARIYVMGYYPGRATGIGQEIVQRANGFLRDYSSGASGRGRASSPNATADIVERLTGRRPDSIDSAYESHYFSLGSSRIPPPAPARPAPEWANQGTTIMVPASGGVAPRAIAIPMPQTREVVIQPRTPQ